MINLTNKNKILLPSFLRRCMKAYAIKSIIRDAGIELSRVGRSRNWQMYANFEQIENAATEIELDGEKTWLWVAKIMRKQFRDLSHEALLNIAKMNNSITINELVQKTDCTVAQARRVIDELEWDE